MQLKVGQKVVIDRNLGPHALKQQNEYYYGGKTSSVPLGTKARITYVEDEEKFAVEFDDGTRWWMHREEITPLVKEKIEAPNVRSISEISDNIIFSRANQELIIVADGQVYQSDNGETGDSYYEDRGFFRLKRQLRTRNLVRLGSLEEIDRVILARERESIDKLAETFATETISDIVDSSFDNSYQEKVYLEIFPHLRRTSANLEELFGVKLEEKDRQNDSKTAKKLKTLVKGVLENKLSQLSQKLSKKQTTKLDALLAQEEETLTPFTYMLQSYDCLLSKGNAFKLVESSRGRRGVVIEGKRYKLVNTELYQTDFVGYYKSNLTDLIEHRGIREFCTDELIDQLIASKDITLGNVRGKKKFQEGPFGFKTMKNGALYVHLDVPAYAIKSQFDNNVYYFEPTSVSINVWTENGKLKYGEKVFMTNNNNHPFLHNEIGNYAMICQGSQSFPVAGDTNGEVIAKRLLRAREMIMYGYTSNSYYDCYKLTKKCGFCKKDHYSSNLTTAQEMMKRGIPIIDGGKRA